MQTNPIFINLRGEKIALLKEKAIFWEQEKALFLSDLHLGKANHFQKNGMALPNHHDKNDLDKLAFIIKENKANKVFFLGDLFHSAENLAVEQFNTFIKKFTRCKFYLIIGNHDIIPNRVYNDLKLSCHSSIEIGPFIFSHEEITNSSKYNIHGHVHPGIKLKGKAKQSLRTACFYFSSKHAILPAFGSSTGLYIIEPKKTDLVFALSDQGLIPMQESNNIYPIADLSKSGKDS